MSTESRTDPEPGRVRASDAEREQYAHIVREATGDGRLTLPEGDERMARVYAARYRDELRPIIADLPAAASLDRPDLPQRRGGWAPREYAPPHPGAFVFHAGAVVIVSAALVGLWASTGGHFFWPAIPLFFFAMGLVRHARWGGRRRHYYRGMSR